MNETALETYASHEIARSYYGAYGRCEIELAVVALRAYGDVSIAMLLRARSADFRL